MVLTFSWHHSSFAVLDKSTILILCILYKSKKTKF